MDKVETTLEIQDLVNFNQAEINTMQSKSPEVYNAFKSVLELLDKKYGSGSFELKTLQLQTPNLIPLKLITIQTYDKGIDRGVSKLLINWETAHQELSRLVNKNNKGKVKLKVVFEDGTIYERRTFTIEKGAYDITEEKLNTYLKRQYDAGQWDYVWKDGKLQSVDAYDWGDANNQSLLMPKIKLQFIKIDGNSYNTWDSAYQQILSAFQKIGDSQIELVVRFEDGYEYTENSFNVDLDVDNFNPTKETLAKYLYEFYWFFSKNGYKMWQSNRDSYDWDNANAVSQPTEKSETELIPLKSIEIIKDGKTYTFSNWDFADVKMKQWYKISNNNSFKCDLKVTWENNSTYNVPGFTSGKVVDYEPTNMTLGEYLKTLHIIDSDGKRWDEKSELEKYDYGLPQKPTETKSKAVKLPTIPLNEIWSEDWEEKKLPKTPTRKPKAENEIGLGNDSYMYVADAKLKWKKIGKFTFDDSEQIFKGTLIFNSADNQFIMPFFDVFCDLADKKVFQNIDVNNAYLQLKSKRQDAEDLDYGVDVIDEFDDKIQYLDRIIKDKYQ